MSLGFTRLPILENPLLLPLLQITSKVLGLGKIKARKICRLILHWPCPISPEAIKQKLSTSLNKGRKRENNRERKIVSKHSLATKSEGKQNQTI